MRGKFKRKKYYKYSKVMKFLTFLGGLLALIGPIIGLIDWTVTNITYPLKGFRYTSIPRAIVMIVGIFGAITAFIILLRPNNPIPFNWIILLIIGTYIIVISFCLIGFEIGMLIDNIVVLFTVLGGISVILACIIGLFEDIKDNQPNLTKW